MKTASELDEALRKQAREWPLTRATTGAELMRLEKELDKAIAEVRTAIDGLDARVVTAALALDWLRPDRWSNGYVWERALSDSYHKRWNEAARIKKPEIERLLTEFGESKTRISNYLQSLQEDSLGGPPEFPTRAPGGWNLKEVDGETATTDFIVRTLVYDRGSIFLVYGMATERLATLQPDRIAWMIPSMLGSADRDSWVAWRAIEQVKGMHFVDELLRRQVEGEKHDLRIFAWADDRQWGRDCLHAAFERSRKDHSAWSRSQLWNSVRLAGLVDQRIVDEALADLEALEKRSPEKDTEWDRRQYRSLDEALRQFLQAAKSSRSGEDQKPATAKELRDWFKEHPEKSSK